MARRQPLVTGRWGSLYRSWFWAPKASSKNKKRGKRRSAKRERQNMRTEILTEYVLRQRREEEARNGARLD